jgi:hypothetical protein
LPRMASHPSHKMSGTITRAATGSAHQMCQIALIARSKKSNYGKVSAQCGFSNIRSECGTPRSGRQLPLFLGWPGHDCSLANQDSYPQIWGFRFTVSQKRPCRSHGYISRKHDINVAAIPATRFRGAGRDPLASSYLRQPVDIVYAVLGLVGGRRSA